MTACSSPRGASRAGRNRASVPLLTVTLLALLATASQAATTIRVVNPFSGAIINTNVSPQVYVINGTCHQADAVGISINDGPETPATVRGAVWEWRWDLTGVAPTNDLKIVATPYLLGVAGTPEELHVFVRNTLPGGALDILPGSVISGLFAGKGATLGNPALPLEVRVVVRADAGAGQTIDQITLSSPTSVSRIYTVSNLEKINTQTVGATSIPAVFSLGDDPVGVGLRERVEAVGVVFRNAPSGTKSNILQRRIIVDPTPPVRKLAVSASYPRKNVVALTGKFSDATSGIESVVVEITPPGGGATVTVPAILTYGADYNSDVAWRVEYETAVGGVMNAVVIARDNAGNETLDPSSGTFSVTTDRTAPSAAFTGPAASAFVTGPSVAVAGTITDASSVTWVLNDNGNFLAQGAGAAFGTTWNTELVPDGPHTLKAIATDAQFNEGSGEVTVTVDNTRPEATFSRPVNGDFVTGFVQITGAIRECNIEGWVIQVDTGSGFVDIPGATGTTNNVSAVWDTSAIPANTVCVLRIVATDKAGLTNTFGESQDAITVTVVKTGSVTITDPADGAYIRGTYKIKFDVAVDALDSWELHDLDSAPTKLTDGTTNGSFEFDWNTVGKDGRHTLKLTGKNKLGQSVDTSKIVTVDNTPPAVVITAPSTPFVRGTAPINATIADANPDKFDVRLNGAVLTPPGVQTGSTVAVVWNTTLFADGPYTIKVLAVDRALNDNSASADSVAVTVDNTPPVVAITSPANGAFIQGATTVTGTFVEANLLKWEWFDNGVMFATGDTASPTSVAWNPTNDGPHTLRLVVTDQAGNTAAALVVVTVDTAPPVLTLNVAPTMIVGATTFVKGTINVTGTATDPNLQGWTLTDTGDAGFVKAGATPAFAFAYDTIGKDGPHQFVVNAVDKAGNASAPVAVSVTADNTKPVVTITAPADGSFVKGTIALTGTVTDTNLKDWQWLDNGRPVPGGSGSGSAAAANLNTTLGPDGAHTITLIGRDLAGNVEDTVSVAVIADNSPPSVTIDALPKVQDGADFFVEGVVRLVGTIVEANLLNWKLTDDNDPALNKTGTQPGGISEPYTTTGEGIHTFRLKATDKVGLTDEKTVTVIADNVPPTATLNAPTPNQTVGSRVFVKGPVTITGTVGDSYFKDWSLKAAGTTIGGNATPGGVSVPWDTSALVGAIELQLTARDRILHSKTDTRTVIADNRGPVVKITSPIPGTTLPPSVAMGSILTLIFRVDHQAVEPSGARAPLTKLPSTGGDLNAPAVTVTVQGPSGSFGLSLADALTKPNLVDKLHGSATVSGSADDGFMVIWQLPILRTGYSYGKEYTVRITGASDVLGNQGSNDQILFRVSLTR